MGQCFGGLGMLSLLSPEPLPFWNPFGDSVFANYVMLLIGGRNCPEKYCPYAL